MTTTYKPLMPTTPIFAVYHDACRRSHDLFAAGDLRGADAAAIEAQDEADRLQTKLPPALLAVFNRCRIKRMIEAVCGK